MKEYVEKRIRPHYRMIAVDCETTGVNTEKDEVLQISIVDEDGKTLINTYCAPEIVRNWAEAERVNGISWADVQGHAPFRKYAALIQRIFDAADEIVLYNAGFDLKFISRIGVLYDGAKVVDMMIKFAEVYGEWNDYYGGYRWQKLIACADYYGVTFNPHNSLDDARATMKCYQKYLEEVKQCAYVN